MNLGPEMFREIVSNGKVEVDRDKKLMQDNIVAWKEPMRRGEIDIRDVLLYACRNSSWVHQRLMTQEQAASFLMLINAVMDKYNQMTNTVNPNIAKLGDVVETIISNTEL